MRKLLLTFLAVFYLGVSSGATVHFHYCMDELVNWGLSSTKGDACSNCGMPKKDSKSCCKEEAKQAKLEKSDAASQAKIQFKQPLIHIDLLPGFRLESFDVVQTVRRSSLSNAPPVDSSVPVFVKNCTYRI
ncbi:MAG TPA: hypothetical protein VEV16_01025 [Daejeonella sp.]|nr:hypothetical protein [Daejeonella sp.]